MRNWVLIILCVFCAVALPGGQSASGNTTLPPATPVECDDGRVIRDDLSPQQEQSMWEDIHRSVARLRAVEVLLPLVSVQQAVTYAFPLRMAPGLTDYAGVRVSAFADHNSAASQVTDYNGGTRSYDGHRGTDYALYPFGWNKLDAGEVQVVAAAAGTIISKSNGDPTDHNPCDSGSSSDNWNYVALTHADGRMTIYGHLRYNSLTSKGVGQSVAQGEVLGTAASSGNSSGPHLHFEVRYGGFSSSEWIDPYAGPNSQSESLWANQRSYFDSAINKLATHSAPPISADCQPTITHIQTSFSRPARIYFYAYYRDYQTALVTQLKINRPDGSIYASWQVAPGGASFYSGWAQGWVYDFSTGEPSGTWRFEAVYNGQVYETFFDLQPQLIARDDFAITAVNDPVKIYVLGNDDVPQGSPVTITVAVPPKKGTVSVIESYILYTPGLDFLGEDGFTYRVNVGAEQAHATVTVGVVAQVNRLFLPLINR